MIEALPLSRTEQRARHRSLSSRLTIILVALLAATLLTASACSSQNVEVSFQPFTLPVKITWKKGEIEISGERDIVTPVGTIKINAGVTLEEPDEEFFYVTLRDKQRDVDHVYKVNAGAGAFHAVVNGTTHIQAENRHVLITVKEGEIKTIEFRKAQSTLSQEKPGPVDKVIDHIVGRWNEYWESTWHPPFAWARWAYDDSTMGAVPPFGFLWFLVRLVAAIILGLIDLVLLALCFLAAIAFIIGGTVLMNIVYGIAALIGLFILFLLVLALFE